MGWNYRVIKHTSESGQVWMAVHECYYDKECNVTSWTEDPSCPSGESLEEMRWDLEKMAQALDYPVIEVEHKLGQNGICGND